MKKHYSRAMHQVHRDRLKTYQRLILEAKNWKDTTSSLRRYVRIILNSCGYCRLAVTNDQRDCSKCLLNGPVYGACAPCHTEHMTEGIELKLYTPDMTQEQIITALEARHDALALQAEFNVSGDK